MNNHALIERINSQPILKNIFEFIFDNRIPSFIEEDFTSIPKITNALLFSIGTNNKDLAFRIHEIISKRNPEKESAWIYDDLLVFLLTITVAKFKINKDWLSTILIFWTNAIDEELKLVGNTCFKFLETHNNYDSTFHPLFLLLQNLIGEQNISKDLIYSSFIISWRERNQYRLEILNIALLRCPELSILYAEIENYDSNKKLKVFETVFTERIKQIATIINIIFHLFITLLVFFVFKKFPLIPDTFYLKTIINFFIGGGIGIASLYIFWKQIQSFIIKLLSIFFGYSFIKPSMQI